MSAGHRCRTSRGDPAQIPGQRSIGAAMSKLQCAYLDVLVDLTGERRDHIANCHPELGPGLLEYLAGTLSDPDAVRRSRRSPQAWLFSRWYHDLAMGKHVVVVLVRDREPAPRDWIITAYVTSRLRAGALVWKRS